jgi:hypothetical protein
LVIITGNRGRGAARKDGRRDSMADELNRRTFMKKSTGLLTWLTISSSLRSNLFAEERADIAVVEGTNPTLQTRAAIQALGGIKAFVRRGDRVVLLPNSEWRHAGAVVNPAIGVEIARLCAEAGAASIVLTTNVEAPTITSTDLFDRQAIPAIDFLSINVELSEPRVLDEFAVGRFRRRLVCIEAQAEVRRQILEFFTRHSCAVVGKYLGVDMASLYFIPWNGFAPRFLRRTGNFWVVWRSVSPGGTATGARSAPDTARRIASRMSSRATSLPRDPILTGASTSRSS